VVGKIACYAPVICITISLFIYIGHSVSENFENVFEFQVFLGMETMCLKKKESILTRIQN
jgi:hypothetical protein